ncbi:MAG: YbaN family protein [Euryarchaeota archaeon]|nr:YbaN family protein [Euryarchaeota archaeon]MBT5594169.1 YbaN family protein [Euryarchaeota archaeon]MBT5844119.1 YbaN family protein [Euryarchaeota archaeon]MBT6641042.1 YbaN family protein [Euryarchaeota archaeon]MBT6844627.1 YbaN family protein [Euryarchaeota archaeon]
MRLNKGVVGMGVSYSSATVEISEEAPSKPLSNLSEEEIIQQVLSEHKPSRNAFIRGLWISIGSIAVLFAVIGVFIPGWPTTSWLVLSAYCYARSSQKMFRWLLTNRMFGGALLEYYRTGRSLPFHSKIVIAGIICLASVASIWAITKAGDPGFGQSLVAIVAIVGVWWIGWRVPTTV